MTTKEQILGFFVLWAGPERNSLRPFRGMMYRGEFVRGREEASEEEGEESVRRQLHGGAKRRRHGGAKRRRHGGAKRRRHEVATRGEKKGAATCDKESEAAGGGTQRASCCTDKGGGEVPEGREAKEG